MYFKSSCQFQEKINIYCYLDVINAICVESDKTFRRDNNKAVILRTTEKDKFNGPEKLMIQQHNIPLKMGGGGGIRNKKFM